MNTALQLCFCLLFAVAGLGLLAFAVGYVFRGIRPAKRQNAQMTQDALYLGVSAPKDNTGLRIVCGCTMTASALAMLGMSVVLYYAI